MHLSLSLNLSLRKGLSEKEVTSEDREHAKRVVYSVVYGAGEYKHLTEKWFCQWIGQMMSMFPNESITGLNVVGFEMQAVHSLKRVNESAL